ncbi:EVE domain-containing protein [Kribbella sp. NPDC056345]|uniref:EVE domain-containing protein n=1 Tax=Kribbella sp. NPDC056345 TaxID=3345789 RepID=UPI0035DB2E25
MIIERAWLAVVSAEHTHRAVAGGFVQLNHGRRPGVARLHRGDGFVIYSPTDQYGTKTPLRAFTALGIVADDTPYQAAPMSMGSRGTIAPWRRTITFQEVTPLPLTHITANLDLTTQPNWGYQLRRGLVPLTRADFATLQQAMTTSTKDRT